MSKPVSVAVTRMNVSPPMACDGCEKKVDELLTFSLPDEDHVYMVCEPCMIEAGGMRMPVVEGGRA